MRITIELNATHVKARLAVPRLVFNRTYSVESTEAANATEPTWAHVAEISSKRQDRKLNNNATCETGRDGKGLTSRSEPSSSSSSCHPGNVDRSRITIKPNTMETILRDMSLRLDFHEGSTYKRGEKSTLALNWLPCQMRFKGSSSALRRLTIALALWPQDHSELPAL